MLSSLDLALPRLFSLEEAEGSWGDIFTVHKLGLTSLYTFPISKCEQGFMGRNMTGKLNPRFQFL